MDLVSLAKNPVPSGAVVGTFPGYDGAPLRFARWDATRGPRRGTVCLFTGRAEFIEKYFEVIADLRRRGFAVATFDWRGQGGSVRALTNKAKGYVGNFAEYDKDLVRFMKNLVLPDCPPPYIGLAHSMGGNILMRHAVMPGSWFDRLIVTAPLISVDERYLKYPAGLVRTYAETCSAIGLSSLYVLGGRPEPMDVRQEFAGNPLTSDHERWARNRAIVQAAPHLGLGSPTIGWLRACLRSCARISEPGYPLAVQVPMLMFAAGNDAIVSTRAIEEFGVRLKVGTHLLIPHARHEILMETESVRQRFWAAFDAYLGITAAAA